MLAWLRCKVRRAAAALRASGGALAGMDEPGLAAYAAGLLGEWLAPAWQRRLAAACGVRAEGAFEPADSRTRAERGRAGFGCGLRVGSQVEGVG